jgi:hypothetical protein
MLRGLLLMLQATEGDGLAFASQRQWQLLAVLANSPLQLVVRS